jgi:hypothetical protein
MGQALGLFEKYSPSTLFDFFYMYVEMEIPHQAGIGHFYHIFYEGCLTDHEVGEDEEASSLYPDVKYKRMDDYLRMFL